MSAKLSSSALFLLVAPGLLQLSFMMRGFLTNQPAFGCTTQASTASASAQLLRVSGTVEVAALKQMEYDSILQDMPMLHMHEACSELMLTAEMVRILLDAILELSIQTDARPSWIWSHRSTH
ncbi:hypothetical protein WJX74_002678 [Apatococcus lobatus]|uniref:Uncharacterized protein n=1 Tax=Apatococcus lobatus TaxID=904363 RepID=A0AAW1RJ56_9CHLO